MGGGMGRRRGGIGRRGGGRGVVDTNGQRWSKKYQESVPSPDVAMIECHKFWSMVCSLFLPSFLLAFAFSVSALSGP